MGLEDRSEGKFNKVENFDIYHGQLDFPHEYKTVEIYITKVLRTHTHTHEKQQLKILATFFIERKRKYVSLHQINTLSSSNEILLEGTQESALLLGGLESTVTELGRGIDPFELGLLGRPPVGLGVQSLAQSHDTLLDTGDGTLKEEEVVLDLTVVDETTHTDLISTFFFCIVEQMKTGTYGVICFLEMSNSEAALPSSLPFPTRKTLWLHDVRWW